MSWAVLCIPGLTSSGRSCPGTTAWSIGLTSWWGEKCGYTRKLSNIVYLLLKITNMLESYFEEWVPERNVLIKIKRGCLSKQKYLFSRWTRKESIKSYVNFGRYKLSKIRSKNLNFASARKL